MRSLIVFAVILIVAACAVVTVQTSTGQGAISHEADKGVVIKPKIDKDSHENR